jgi:adenylylsulfate kinase-like enzyme
VIILFCGIPGSGKTTIAEILSKQLSELGRVRLLTSDKLKAPVYRKLFKALAPDQNRGDFLILDATFYKEEWRRHVRELAQGERVLTIYLECPLQVALERNRRRQPNISQKAVHIIFHKMDPPKNPSMRIDTASTSASDAAAQIFEFIKSQQTDTHQA